MRVSSGSVVGRGLLLAVGVSLLATARAADVGITATTQPPQVVFTRLAGVHLRQEARVQLQPGDNRFLVDFGRYEIDPATLDLRVLEPAEGVQVMGRDFSPRQPGQVVFLLRAAQPTNARLSVNYALKGLESEVSYSILLAPQSQTLALEAQVALRNNSKQPLPQAQVLLPGGHVLGTGLELGQSVQQRFFRCEAIPYQVRYLYDNTRYKDSVRAILKLERGGSSDFDKLALPAGKVKVFAPTAGNAPGFVAEATAKYAPAHEALELDLGTVPDITILRTKLRGDQANARTDVYKKLALFDLDEEYELEVENHRAAPVTIAFDEHIPGEWQITKANVPWQKLDAGTVELTLKLEPGQKTKMNYVVKRLNVEP